MPLEGSHGVVLVVLHGSGLQGAQPFIRNTADNFNVNYSCGGTRSSMSFSDICLWALIFTEASFLCTATAGQYYCSQSSRTELRSKGGVLVLCLKYKRCTNTDTSYRVSVPIRRLSTLLVLIKYVLSAIGLVHVLLKRFRLLFQRPLSFCIM